MRLERLLPGALLVALVMGTASGQPAEPLSEVDHAPLMTLPELEEEIGRRESDLRRYNERLEELTRQNEEVRARLEEREADLRSRERHVRERVVTLCRLSRGGYVQLLRGAQTWADVVRRAQITRAVVDRDIEALREHQTGVEELARQRLELGQRLETQRQLRERIANYQRELEAERQRRLEHASEYDAIFNGDLGDDGLPALGF